MDTSCLGPCPFSKLRLPIPDGNRTGIRYTAVSTSNCTAPAGSSTLLFVVCFFFFREGN